MDIQPIQTQHHLNRTPSEARPADVKWLGMVDDHVLLSRAKGVAVQTAYINHAARVFEIISSKLTSWRFAQDSWHVAEQ